MDFAPGGSIWTTDTCHILHNLYEVWFGWTKRRRSVILFFLDKQIKMDAPDKILNTARRSHRKTRTGCRTCKRRYVALSVEMRSFTNGSVGKSRSVIEIVSHFLSCLFSIFAFLNPPVLWPTFWGDNVFHVSVWNIQVFP